MKLFKERMNDLPSAVTLPDWAFARGGKVGYVNAVRDTSYQREPGGLDAHHCARFKTAGGESYGMVQYQ
jgi:hypothetical protein